MSKTKITPYDGANHYRDRDAQARLLTEALTSGEGAFIRQALNTIANAQGKKLDLPPSATLTFDSPLNVLAMLKLELRLERAA